MVCNNQEFLEASSLLRRSLQVFGINRSIVSVGSLWPRRVKNHANRLGCCFLFDDKNRFPCPTVKKDLHGCLIVCQSSSDDALHQLIKFGWARFLSIVCWLSQSHVDRSVQAYLRFLEIPCT